MTGRYKPRPPTQYEILMAHTEALALNAEVDRERIKRMREVFGFVPCKTWTKAQKARASQVSQEENAQ